MRTLALVALTALILSPGTGVRGQTPSQGPPILLPTPSHPSAPSASTRIYGERGALIVHTLAVDGQDNAYLAGSASDSVELAGFDHTFGRRTGGAGDAFVAKVDRSGRGVWVRFIGGADQRAGTADTVRAIALDPAGQVWMAGTTFSTDFPIVAGFQPFGRSGGGRADAFIAKVSADGSRLLYSTYYGSSSSAVTGEGETTILGLHAGPAGDAWVAVSPVAGLATTHDLSNGGRGVVVLKVNPAGQPIWSTRLPAADAVDLGTDGPFVLPGARLVVDQAGDSYVGVANTIVKLSHTGTQVRYSTPVPALGFGRITGLAYLGSSRVAAVVSANFGDAFLAILSANGALVSKSGSPNYASYNTAVAACATGELAIAGDANEHAFPTVRALIDYHVDGPVYSSRDRGQTWQVSGPTTQLPFTAQTLVPDPSGSIIYALGVGAVQRTHDDGASWQNYLEPNPLSGVLELAFDPRPPFVGYAWTISGDLYRRDMPGSAWRAVSRLLPVEGALAVSPHDGSLWATGNGARVSEDGGVRWTPRGSGLPISVGGFGAPPTRVFPNRFAFHPADPRTLYALFGVRASGLWFSGDRGGQWRSLISNIDPTAVRDIAFDPANAAAIYVATQNQGLLRTSDGGGTWTRSLDGAISVVATDHQRRHLVYAGGFDLERRPAFYISVDRGDTWFRWGTGLNLRSAPAALLVDPRDSSRLYVGSDVHEAVPHVRRFDLSGSESFGAPAFASYLGAGRVAGLACGPTGDTVVALNYDASQWTATTPSDSTRRVALLRIGR